ncbi:85_t:CDS:2 [Ambispora gerdemannii]|uniref:85_t:CDS:1 n=1 Tax=Ambispora gerdemannii TaxID=144530 RepID=A0A9N8Z0H8_9GLOM|nr:85_t:CDS:2 [Ambispora gerdemannii]
MASNLPPQHHQPHINQPPQTYRPEIYNRVGNTPPINPYYRPDSPVPPSSRTSLDSNDQLFSGFSADNAASPNYGSTNKVATDNPKSEPRISRDDHEFMNVGEEDPKKDTKIKGFLKNRKKACCFLCCGVSIIIAAIMIPVAIFVIAPAIAQGAVTGSKLSFSSANLTNLTEDAFLMKVNGKVTSTGPMAATIDVPDGVEVSWNGLVLGRLPLDTISAAPFVGADIDSSQTFTISNKTAFGEFNKFMLTSKEFTWHLEGLANVRAAGLSLKGIRLSKDVKMDGMANFPDVSIKTFDAPSDHPAGGITVQILSIMVNPSPIGVELGDLEFDVLYNNQKIGEVTSSNVTLGKGANALNLNGRLIPQNTSAGLAAVSEMFSKYIAGENANTSVLAKTVKPSKNNNSSNDTTPISWLQSAFVGTTLSVVLRGAQNLTVINSVDLKTMDLTFSKDKAYSPIAQSDALSASFKIPFGFQLNMKKISQDITIYGGSNALATLSTPYTDANGDSSVGKIDSKIPPTPFDVIKGSESNFQEFSRHLTMDSSVVMTMKGKASSIASTSIGEVEIKGIKFIVDTQLQGLQGLQVKPATINSLSVTGGTKDYMIIKLSVTLFNPSNVKISMGDVILDLYYHDQNVGQVLMNNFVLDRGSNTVDLITHFGPNGDKALAAGRILLNTFMKGDSNTVGIQGSPHSTEIESLKKALVDLKLSTSMPGLKAEQPILVKSRFTINLGTVFTKKGTASVDAYNPLDTTIKFLKMKATITFKGQIIGTLDQDLTGSPIVIPPKKVATTRDLDLNLQISLTAIQSLFAGISGDLATDITSTIVLAIGDYVTEIDYAQNQVPTGLGHGLGPNTTISSANRKTRNGNNSFWTAYEDNQLRELYIKHPNNFRKIKGELSRTRVVAEIRKRVKELGLKNKERNTNMNIAVDSPVSTVIMNNDFCESENPIIVVSPNTSTPDMPISVSPVQRQGASFVNLQPRPIEIYRLQSSLNAQENRLKVRATIKKLHLLNKPVNVIF